MDAAPSPRRRLRLPPPPPPDAATSLDTLPPEILDTILSRLSLRDAVRTSVLSRAWRHRWESVPSLEFKWQHPLPVAPRGVDPGAITGVLSRYSCRVRKFQHYEIPEAAFRHSDAWLRILAHNGVETLVLYFETSASSIHTLHPSIFSCRDLTALYLQHCNVPAMPPGFAGLPNLTRLGLAEVDFIGEAARELELWIDTSPLLEYLYLQCLRITESNGVFEPWVIQAPKLRVLCINEHADRWWQVNDLPSLEKAVIEYYGEHDFINLVTAVAAARRLRLNIPIADGNVLEGLTRPFNNLKKLSLHVTLCLQSSVLPVFCLLRNAPKLQRLHIELDDDDPSLDDEVDRQFLNEQWTDDLFSNLTSVDIMDLMCKSSEMHFIEFVLSKASRLEKLKVYIAKDCPRSNEDVLMELVKFRRASSRAEVFFERIR